LRLPLELREVFCDWLHLHFPDRAARVLARLSDMRAGAQGGHGAGGRKLSAAQGAGQSVAGARLNDSRFHHRMRGQGHWADLIRLRFELGCRKHGLVRDRPELDIAQFSPPSRDGQLGLFDV
jgi:hypothetical protein